MYRPNLAFLAHSDRNFSAQAPQSYGSGFHASSNNLSSSSSGAGGGAGGAASAGAVGGGAVGRSCLERMADVVEYLQNEKRNQSVRGGILISIHDPGVNEVFLH
jgi:uncharacterized protein YcfJ